MPAVEQRRRRTHEVERRQHFVELDRPRLAVDLVQRQAHRHAHEERLGQLESTSFVVQEVAVVQRLQAEVVELQVALRPERRGELLQVEERELVIQQLRLDAVADELGEVLGVALGHRRLRDFLAQRLAPHRVQQQPRGDVGVGRVLLDQGARSQDRRLVDFLERHAVVQVLERLPEDGIGRDVLRQSFAGRAHQRLDARHVERNATAFLDHRQRRRRRRGRRLPRRGALLRTPFAVQHVSTRHVVRAVAHQREFDLVLHVFDMERTAGRLPAQQCRDDAGGELLHLFADRRRRSALAAAHGDERLGHRHRDLRRLERHDRAIATDDLVVTVRRRLHAGHPTPAFDRREMRCRPDDRRGRRLLKLHKPSDAPCTRRRSRVGGISCCRDHKL